LRTHIVFGPGFSQAIRQLPLTGLVVILLKGDRLRCCDEAAIVEIDSKVVAVATIAPLGEENNGQPTICVYVLPTKRGLGFGRKVFQAALVRCQERGFAKVRVDVMSTGMAKIIAGLSEDERAQLEVHDLSRMLDMFPE